MVTYHLRVKMIDGSEFNKDYSTEPEAQAALDALSLDDNRAVLPGMVRTPDGYIVINRAQMQGAQITKEDYGQESTAIPANPIRGEDERWT